MTFFRAYYHLIWSTKYRSPVLTSEIEEHLYPLLVNKALNLGCQVFAINGWVDHVHMVMSIPPKYSVSEVVKLLKGASSYDLKIKWQVGYGVLTVGERQKDIPIRYVENQKQHHASKSTNTWLERSDDAEEEGHEIREAGSKYEIKEDDGEGLLF